MALSKGFVWVNSILLFSLFYSSFSHSSLLQVSTVSSKLRGCSVNVGDTGTKGYFSGLLSGGTCYYSSSAYNNCWIISSGLKAYCNTGIGNGQQILWLKAANVCPDGQELNESGVCEDAPEDCPELKGQDAPFPQGPVPDDSQSLGSSRLSCNTANHCEILSGYRASNGSMVKDSFYTGEGCVGNPDDYTDCPYYGSCNGQTPPEEEDLEDPWDGCSKPYVDSAFVCREDTDGDGKPNPDAPYDDGAYCDHDSSGKFSCSGGSFDKDKPTDPVEPTEPDGDISNPDNIPDASGDPATIQPVAPPEEVTEPELTPDSNGDIVKAVTSMNRDFNKALNDLNIDINHSQADINTELDRLNKNVVNNSNATRDLAQTNTDIYNNTKQLIQGVEVAVKTGTVTTVEAINTNGENTVNAVNSGFSDVGDSLDEIKGSLDGIANVDTSSAGTSGSCIETDNCIGFYASGYPNGLSGVANAHFESIKANVLDGFVNTFGNLDLSNAKRPSFTIPVMDFGDYDIEDYINLDWVFGFARFCLIFTAIATARKNILGG